jgi:hypothetical protein
VNLLPHPAPPPTPVISIRAVFAREQANGSYSIGPYVLANFVTSLPGMALIAMCVYVVCTPFRALLARA